MTDIQILISINEAIDGKKDCELMQALVDVVRDITSKEVSKACAQLITERDIYKERYTKAAKELTKLKLDVSLIAAGV